MTASSAGEGGRVVILDRDGVINHDSPDYIKSAAEWHPIPGSMEAIARFKQAGWRIAVASNQAGIARGLLSQTDLDGIHACMQQAAKAAGGEIDVLVYCPHAPEDHCDCRKPAPGLLQQVARQFDVSLDDVPFIGDKLTDIEAARAAGARPILVRTGNGEATWSKVGFDPDITVFADLSAAASALIKAG